MSETRKMGRRVLVTGGFGYLGKNLVKKLIPLVDALVVTDIFIPELSDVGIEKTDHLKCVLFDVRKEGLEKILSENRIDTVVHLASVVTPKHGQDADFCYQVDVVGTKNALEACIRAKVEHIIISSSGAAYGYHSDNPEWLKETDAIRGNQIFPYSYHKRLVEEMLLEYRTKHPELLQTIFRVGTILGDSTKNQITDLFEKKRMLGIKGYKSPFVFIWDQDLVEIFIRAILERKTGIFNVAGDGALPIDEIAKRLGKSVLWIPSSVLRVALKILHKLRLSQYDSDQVLFLQYRPVLSNERLKTEFGYVPKKTSSDAFQYWKDSKLSPRSERSQ